MKKNAKEEFLELEKTAEQQCISAEIRIVRSKRDWIEVAEDDHFDAKVMAVDILAVLPQGYDEEERENFLDTIDIEYEAGYGGQELFGQVTFDGIWADRDEYDGSEWWNLHTPPAHITRTEANAKMMRRNIMDIGIRYGVYAARVKHAPSGDHRVYWRARMMMIALDIREIREGYDLPISEHPITFAKVVPAVVRMTDARSTLVFEYVEESFSVSVEVRDTHEKVLAQRSWPINTYFTTVQAEDVVQWLEGDDVPEAPCAYPDCFCGAEKPCSAALPLPREDEDRLSYKD